VAPAAGLVATAGGDDASADDADGVSDADRGGACDLGWDVALHAAIVSADINVSHHRHLAGRARTSPIDKR